MRASNNCFSHAITWGSNLFSMPNEVARCFSPRRSKPSWLIHWLKPKWMLTDSRICFVLFPMERIIQGAEHPYTAEVLHGLAELYQQQGKYEQAAPLFQ